MSVFNWLEKETTETRKRRVEVISLIFAGVVIGFVIGVVVVAVVSWPFPLP